jgi:hypothetical protein
MGQMDTNAPFRLAIEWLSALSIDVEALKRDCSLRVHAFTPEGKKGEHFVPLYWVYWTRIPEGRGSVASVELFLPTKTLLQLRVEESKYILRKPLEPHGLDAFSRGTSKRKSD